MIGLKLAGAVAAASAAIIAGLVWYAADADSALDREQKKLVTAELQREQFAKGLTQCRTEIAEKNAIVGRFTELPEVRLRLCVQRAPSDGCCKPAPAECKP